jgi:ubiquinone/menaquinone biosynthesis C-methylase UbiE
MALGDTGPVEEAEYALMDAVENRMWWYRAMHSRVLAALGGLAPGARVLDAGCGTGGFLARLRAARPDLRLLGVEFARDAARRAATKSGAAVIVGSVNALPLRDGVVDAVVSLDVLCHAAAEPPVALAEFHRVLAPGGRLVLNLPAHDWLRSAHDARVHNARRYERSTAAAMLGAAGFMAAEARHWNSLLLPLMVVQRKVLARRDDAASDVAEYPAWLDRSLYAVTRVEAALLRAGLRFPAGGSLIATATRG